MLEKENRNCNCGCNNNYMMNNNSNMMIDNNDYPNTNTMSAGIGRDNEKDVLQKFQCILLSLQILNLKILAKRRK